MIPIAQIVPLTWAEGPGPRLALWVQGCTLRCPGCCNAALQLFEGEEGALTPSLLTPHQILDMAPPGTIEGITLLGGEPMAHAQSLLPLALLAAERGLTVMTFTGYPLEYLLRQGTLPQLDLLDSTDLLVDGPYIASKHDARTRRWVGSSNQKVRALTSAYRDRLHDGTLLAGKQTVELRYSKAGVSINGWPAVPEAEASRILRSNPVPGEP
jgi:anaerobic ribonucleoside-triphosphate reductase activating protein